MERRFYANNSILIMFLNKKISEVLEKIINVPIDPSLVEDCHCFSLQMLPKESHHEIKSL